MASYVGDGYTYNLPLLRKKEKVIPSVQQEEVEVKVEQAKEYKVKKTPKPEEDYTVYLEPEDIQTDIKYILPPNVQPLQNVQKQKQEQVKDPLIEENKRLKRIIEKQQKTIDLLITKYVKPSTTNY